jgi:hypothetical protein
MTDDEYMNYWRSRAISAEMKVVKLRNKLLFWRAAGISFGVVVIIITLIA